MTKAWRRVRRTALGVAACGAMASGAAATEPGNWAALASDRQAQSVGDALTVLVYEDASASNSAQTGSKKSASAGGELAGGSGRTQQGRISLNGAYDGSGQSGRSDRIVAQVGVVVTEVLPNGDLRVAGAQALNVNGEHTRIQVRGRVRRMDISGANTVVSSRLADAEIDYAGSGFVARSAKPGLLSRMLSGFGLF